MSLQPILDAIRVSGELQVSEIEKDAYSQAHQILVEARLEAQQEKEDAFIAASSPAYRERSRTLHRARLESLRSIGAIRETLVDTTLDQARGCLQTFRMDTRYPAVLRRLAETALADLEGSVKEPGKTRLFADPRDRVLLTSILRDMGLNLPVSYDLNCWGGLIAESEDSRVVVINTLEARLERAIPYLRRFLSAFFEGEQTDLKSGQVPERVPVL